MRLNFTTNWIFWGWIACVLVTFYAQNAASKAIQCGDKQYLRGQRCCDKCQPGLRVYADCTHSEKTKCVKCNSNEYQPTWTERRECSPQKTCDKGRGFMDAVENPLAEEQCRCRAGLQCHPINCEFCEKIPTCNPGYGLEADPDSTNGRKICVACKKGFFADKNDEECKQWTNCKAEGRIETKPGSAESDAECGPLVSGAASSWVVVSVLSVITVLCLLILLLFCYKDKLKLLSVNLRSCVQNLKRTRIQQETLAPLYNSGAGGGPGGPRCTPCEVTKLICQAPHTPADDLPCTFPSSVPDVRAALPFTGQATEKEVAKEKIGLEDQSEGSGEPEEVSEEEEIVSVPPLSVGSCVCVIPIREPLEVGENEDCSQAVSPGTPGTCSCGGLDGDESDSNRGGKRGGSREKLVSPTSEAGVAPLVSLSPPLLHSSICGPHTELCLPLSQAQVRPEFKSHLTDRPAIKQEALHRLVSTDSPSAENSPASPMTLVSPMTASSSVGDLYLDKPPGACGLEQSQGISWRDNRENKFSSGESELECSPESLHSQLAEPTLTSGQVSGNNNTTFISSGQVMNFSGEVIVVYVSQTSSGSDCAGQADAFGSPVQEEASETAQFFQSGHRSQGDFVSHGTLQDETLPVQEAMEERALGK
ncbi:tumor necrosis factor receptor superfamily member 11A [Mugil cephalus]|uniref:tumor necrosis factor receptor superfamily member 11A n=1 Tax=Mugil cephalus TaxID=48193 RepID=UPI001FB76834|nr:tumor necrosis factor receptor superfamily member 11A [Mugil cephalus]